MTDETKPIDPNVIAAQPAVMAGQGSVIRAKVQVTRAGTGKVEDYDLTFTSLPDEQPTGENSPQGE